MEQQEDSGSLIPDTLAAMAADAELQATLQAIKAKGQAALTREEAAARRRSLQGLGLPSFERTLQDAGLRQLKRGPVTTLQLNIGLYCNQACSHCHVESSPARSEMMERPTADRCLQLLAGSGTATCLDITGGAPELNSQFRHLVAQARQMGVAEIIDRCNLTVLCEPGQEDLPDFLAQHKVRVVASLPCYTAGNVDKQRGRGIFERSIEGLKKLNAVGYGQPGSGLLLDLVYNPGGAFLAPPQAQLEPAYKQELREAHGIEFSSLLALNNMPIKRFADWLIRRGELSDYMAKLVAAFNAGAVPGLMCHSTLSVAWDGGLYDCDFNQQLALGMPCCGSDGAGADSAAAAAAAAAAEHAGAGGAANAQQQGAAAADTAASVDADSGGSSGRRGLTVWDIDSLADVAGRAVVTGSHCYGCTAGAGSSCTGATA